NAATYANSPLWGSLLSGQPCAPPAARPVCERDAAGWCPSVGPATAARQERHIAIPTRDSHWGICAPVHMAGRRDQPPPAHLAHAAVGRRGDAAARALYPAGAAGATGLCALSPPHR